MSRAGYTNDLGGEWQLICWRGAVASAIRGRRGQAFLREMLEALDKLPQRRLIAEELTKEGEVCAIGAVGLARGVDMSDLDPYDYDRLAAAFGIAPAMAREIMYLNDERYYKRDNPEEDRFRYIREWVEQQIRGER